MPLTGTRSRLRRPLGTVPQRDLPPPRHAPEVCPCEGPAEDPGPHLATCPWSDPDYEPCGCEESVALRAALAGAVKESERRMAEGLDGLCALKAVPRG